VEKFTASPVPNGMPRKIHPAIGASSPMILEKLMCSNRDTTKPFWTLVCHFPHDSLLYRKMIIKCTFIETFTHPETQKQVPNLGITLTVCVKCQHIHWTPGEALECCPQGRLFIFEGKNALNDTVNHIFFNPNIKRNLVIAHNGGECLPYFEFHMYNVGCPTRNIRFPDDSPKSLGARETSWNHQQRLKDNAAHVWEKQEIDWFLQLSPMRSWCKLLWPL